MVSLFTARVPAVNPSPDFAALMGLLRSLPMNSWRRACSHCVGLVPELRLHSAGGPFLQDCDDQPLTVREARDVGFVITKQPSRGRAGCGGTVATVTVLAVSAHIS